MQVEHQELFAGKMTVSVDVFDEGSRTFELHHDDARVELVLSGSLERVVIIKSESQGILVLPPANSLIRCIRY